MGATANDIAVAARRVMALQAGAATLVAAGFFFGEGAREAWSGFYGGLISVVTTFLLSRGVVRAADAASQSQKKSMIILYLGAAQRFVLVLVLFGVGLAGLHLAPLPTIAGFVAAQLVYVIGMRAAQK